MALPPLPSGATKERPPLPPGATAEPTDKPIGVGEAMYTGAKTAVMEPIYGAGEFLPGELGKGAASRSKQLEEEYQRTAKQQPIATRAGYFPVVAGEMFIPGTAGVKAAKGAGLLTKAALGGGLSGLTTGAIAPTGEEDYSKRMKEKATGAGLGAALGTTLGLAGGAAGKLPEFVRSFKTPEAIASAEGLTSVGEKGFKLLTDKAKKLFDARSTEAEQKYGQAFDAARKAQAKGQPFITSPPGQALIQSLENEKNIIAGGKKFGVGEEKVKGIDRLINALKGETTGGIERVAKETPTGKKIYSMMGAPKKTTEKDISAIVEELRFLRDVDAKGKPYEAYAQLDAQYKRDLIKKLEEALYQWNPEYKTADEAYKNASAKLAPFKTELMSSALKGEKFNPKDLVASPEDFGTKFFKDVDGVRQLKAVTEDPAEVSKLGKEYVASLLAEKTPAQVKTFASNPQNKAWMDEAGISNEVQKYAQQATTAASRQNLLKYLGYGAVTAVGVPTGYAIRRGLGL